MVAEVVVEEKEILLSSIKQKREKLVKTALMYGMLNRLTLKCSEELDELIVKYQKL